MASPWAPSERTCPACGRSEVTASRTCAHCGTPYVALAQRLSRRAKRGIALAAGLLLVAIFAAGVLLSPGIEETKEERRAAEERARVAIEARERARVTGEQRPVSAITEPAARPVMVERLADFVLRDAQARVEGGKLNGPIRRAFCEPYPGTASRRAEERDPARRRGRYSCIAVSSEIRGAAGERGALGYPFSAVIDYRSGRITWCKANPPPGEQVIGRELVRVDLDPSCSKP